MDELKGTGLARHYYLHLAAAYVRGMIPGIADESAESLFHQGRNAGLRMHRFKRTAALPRVRRVLGILHGIHPATLLDIGSGRGVFLWPLISAFPELPVTALDCAAFRVTDLEAVAAGGISCLTPVRGDVMSLSFAGEAFDVVTILEVLEHLPSSEVAAREVIRVARRAVVATVPSKPDDNREHLRLYSASTLSALFADAAAAAGRSISVHCEHVLNHFVAVVTLR
jgi:ubiquinone/menaquinone biosynthesis C-methylase UbiE